MPSRRFKTDRLLLLAVAASLAAATALYYLIQRTKGLTPRLASDKAILSALAATVVVLVLGLAFILTRNLINLVVERRRGVLGSGFRVKLVFVFAFLLLLPSVALFLGAIAVIDRSLDDLATTPVDEIVKSAEWLSHELDRREQERAAHFSVLTARQIRKDRLLRPGLERRLTEYLRRTQGEYGLNLLGVYRTTQPPRAETEVPSRWRAQVSPLELVEMPQGTVEQVFTTGEPAVLRDDLSYGRRVVALYPIASAGPPERVVGVAAAGYFIGPGTAGRATQVRNAVSDYDETVKRRPAVKRLYIVVFALLTALVLFAGVWTGHYLARQITDPLSSLVEGTRAIRAGDLSHQVTAEARDEIGFLIQSFNQMTAELQRNARELEERRRYTEMLLENAPVGVLSLDAEGRVTTINRAALRILRLDPGVEARGREANDLLGAGHLGPLRETLMDYARGGKGTLQREFQFEHQNRLVGTSVVIGRLQGTDGSVLGTLMVLEDLTALLRAQKQAAWREVARRIAHEIKNPLTPIQLSAQRILKKQQEGAPDLDEALAEGASTIVREVGALKQMVDEFSRFARMPALQPQPLDPKPVLEEAVNLFRPDHPAVHFHLGLESAPVSLMADRDALRRVFVNLLDNALTALEGRGRVEVVAGRIAGTDLYRIEVADDGPGIPAEDREKLFFPYYSTKKRGTGLGLAIVHRIVSDLGGDIRLEDNQPHGTRFIMEFPLHRSPTEDLSGSDPGRGEEARHG